MLRSISFFAIALFGYVGVIAMGPPDDKPQDVVYVPRETKMGLQDVVVAKPTQSGDWNEMGDLSLLEPLLIPHYRGLYGHCGEFYPVAMSVGWEPSEWKKLRHIIARETGNTCDPTVINRNEKTRDLSYGLTQINMRNKLGPDRMARCGLSAYEDLWIPEVNLACARVLYERSGWEPWAYTKKS